MRSGARSGSDGSSLVEAGRQVGTPVKWRLAEPPRSKVCSAPCDFRYVRAGFGGASFKPTTQAHDTDGMVWSNGCGLTCRSRKRSDKNGVSMSRRGGHLPRGAGGVPGWCDTTKVTIRQYHSTTHQNRRNPRGCFALVCAHPLSTSGAAIPGDTGVPEGDLPQREKHPHTHPLPLGV